MATDELSHLEVPPRKLPSAEPYDRVHFRMQADAEPSAARGTTAVISVRASEPAVDGGAGIAEGMLEQRQAPVEHAPAAALSR
ncbi:hypothetical protein [Burkholderia latens]|uniref:Catalase n=1 Tax=Burkholderia latens TaxID=488446 RepID=A0A6P2KNH3_9BURK|nr:catalase [Burkholderia latens]